MNQPLTTSELLDQLTVLVSSLSNPAANPNSKPNSLSVVSTLKQTIFLLKTFDNKLSQESLDDLKEKLVEQAKSTYKSAYDNGLHQGDVFDDGLDSDLMESIGDIVMDWAMRD